MTTTETTEVGWPCACGTGQVVFHYKTPEHGWHPVPYLDRTECTCASCDAQYDFTRDPSVVDGATPDAEDALFFFLKADVAERQSIEATVSTASNRIKRIHAKSTDAAIQALSAAGPDQCKLATEMFGFSDPEATRAFISHKRLSSWVQEAGWDEDRRRNLAAFFGYRRAMLKAEAALRSARETRTALGKPPMRHVASHAADAGHDAAT